MQQQISFIKKRHIDGIRQKNLLWRSQYATDC